MGFLMDGLDAETYDRTYGDRRLLTRILGYFRPELAVMLFTAAMVVLNSLMDAALPILVASGLDRLGERGQRSTERRGCSSARPSLPARSPGGSTNSASHGPPASSATSCSGCDSTPSGR